MLHLKRSSLILMLLLIHSRTEAQGNFYEPAPKVFTGGLVAGLLLEFCHVLRTSALWAGDGFSQSVDRGIKSAHSGRSVMVM